MEQENVNWGISGSSLKIIALFSMLIDHVGAVVVTRMIQCQMGGLWLSDVYWLMRCIGRMAFPIYCFLLVEGYNHTKNKGKYAMRLFLFAIISEIPFDLALNQKVLEMQHSNVFFTLLIGLLVLILLDWVNDMNKIDKSSSTFTWLAMTFLKCVSLMAVITIGMIIAEFVLKTDYGAAGVGCIVIIYLMRSFKEIAFAGGIVLLGLLVSGIEFWALLMLIPISMYNGKRGLSVKYLFYAFYPLHLLVLAGIAYIL